ncbi:MAG: MATE family efflux transporter [Acidobacteriota bacterium]
MTHSGSSEGRRELRALVALAVPIVVAQVGMMLLGTVDAMMLGRVSKEALAAGAVGGTIGFGLLSVPIGILMGLDPLAAQAFGAGDRRRLRRTLERAFALAVLLGLPTMAALWLASNSFELLRQSPEIVPLAKDYLRGLVPGVLPFLFFVVLRQTEQAMGIVRPALLAALVANVWNVFANWVLVFGNLGVPALGVRGSAWATSSARLVLFLVILGATRPVVPYLLKVKPWRQFAPRLHGEMMKIGLPISVHRSLEFWVFSVVGLLMGTLGSLEMSAHQIALNLSSLSFMVPLGIGTAAATRVGNAIGRSDLPAAARSANLSLALGCAVMVVSASLFALLPRLLARLYTAEAQVIALAATLLPIAAAFQFSDSVQTVAAGILRGTADTTWPAVSVFAGFWILGLPIGWWWAFQQGWGPTGLWWGLTLGLTIVAVLLTVRVRVRLRQSLDKLQV